MLGAVDGSGNLNLYMGDGVSGTADQRRNTGPNRQGNDTETSEGFSISSQGLTDPDNPAAGETLLVKFLIFDATRDEWVERAQQSFDNVRQIQASAGSGADLLASILGTMALIFATINVVGGYLVTHRMLAMFKRKGEEKK